MIIGMFGFPQAGKSTYREILYHELLRNGCNFFIDRANPDGDRPLTSRGKAGGEQWLGGVFDQKFLNHVVESAENLKKKFEFVYLYSNELPIMIFIRKILATGK